EPGDFYHCDACDVASGHTAHIICCMAYNQCGKYDKWTCFQSIGDGSTDRCTCQCHRHSSNLPQTVKVRNISTRRVNDEADNQRRKQSQGHKSHAVYKPSAKQASHVHYRPLSSFTFSESMPLI